MAVSTLSRARTRAPQQTASLPPAVLLLTLIAPAVDLLSAVQTGASLFTFGVLATGAATAALLVLWTRFPRTTWLFAAALASAASLAMRVMGVEVAPALSLLAVVALGIGGAFASPASEAEAGLV